MQKKLAADQVAAFYHDGFVGQQVKHFRFIALPAIDKNKVVVDIGGGCGYFSSAISKELGLVTRVIDADPVSIDVANKIGVDAMIGDALEPIIKGDECIACFNLILHHLVGSTENNTLDLQVRAISAWKGGKVKIFVNEYIYESWLPGFSGWLIFQITKNKILSTTSNFVAQFFPPLKANTFGVGVRFRSNGEWKAIFKNAGFLVENEIQGEKEFISKPRRILLIKEIRRDSFLLTSK